MTEKNRLITLKEASELSGYSADYIGQLIREGKIPGKQVYCNIAWMTTAEAVLDYKKSGNKKKGIKNFFPTLSSITRISPAPASSISTTSPNNFPFR